MSNTINQYQIDLNDIFRNKLTITVDKLDILDRKVD